MTIILCDSELVSNPYTKAKIVELVSFFGNEARQIRDLYTNNELAKVNLHKIDLNHKTL